MTKIPLESKTHLRVDQNTKFTFFFKANCIIFYKGFRGLLAPTLPATSSDFRQIVRLKFDLALQHCTAHSQIEQNCQQLFLFAVGTETSTETFQYSVVEPVSKRFRTETHLYSFNTVSVKILPVLTVSIQFQFSFSISYWY